MAAARCLAAISAVCLFIGAPAGVGFYGWRVGATWVCVAVCFALIGWSVDKETRKTRWEIADACRNTQRKTDEFLRQVEDRRVH